jgi:hypothetical protein
MSEELTTQHPVDDRPPYEAPKALRLGGTHAGAGQCFQPGSSDQDFCEAPGNSAGGDGCLQPGLSAFSCYEGSGADSCGIPGNLAPGGCIEIGNTPG